MNSQEAAARGWRVRNSRRARPGLRSQELPPFAQSARYARWLRGASFAGARRRGLPSEAASEATRDAACHPEPRAKRAFGEGWRRGWDSNSVSSFRMCNLQILQCRRCRECQRCRGTLHAIARTAEVRGARSGTASRRCRTQRYDPRRDTLKGRIAPHAGGPPQK